MPFFKSMMPSGGSRLESVEKPQQTEMHFLSAIRQGSNDAFVGLSDQYRPMLESLARRLRNDYVDADDLMQEGLLGLLSAATHYREGEVAFSAYAFLCVRRRMLSAIARATRHKDRVVEDDWQQVLKDSSAEQDTDPAAQVMRRETEERLYAWLRSLLSEREYKVLMLYLDAYSYEEMASRLSISVKAVDNALQRVRQKLSDRGWMSLS